MAGELIHPDASCESRASRFFKQAYEAYERTEKVLGGCLECRYGIGGDAVLLRFAGPGLMPFITPALSHLELRSKVTQPELTVCIWACGPEGARLLAPHWLPQDHIIRGEVRELSDRVVRVAFNPASRNLSLFHSCKSLALHVVFQTKDLPAYELAAPLLAILNWWAQRPGRQIVHAAAVGSPGGGLLLAGRGGSGKSTTALVCMSSGMLYAGDDYCLLEDGSPPKVYSLYNSCKLEMGLLDRLPQLRGAFSQPRMSENGKSLFFLHELYPHRLIQTFPLGAILLPHIGVAGPTRLTRVSAAEGLRALAPSTLFQLPGEDAVALKTLAGIVRKVPCYRLDLGSALADIPAVIRGLLRTEAEE
jgi:hypothetical protein